MASLQPCETLWKRDTVGQLVSKAPATSVGMARRSLKVPDYFAFAKAEALAAAPGYLICMAFRIWLIWLVTGLRVSEALSLRRSDIRPESEASGSEARKDRKG